MEKEIFKSLIEDADIDNIYKFLNLKSDVEVYYGRPNATVSYRLVPHYREWGLGSIQIVIVSVVTSIYWSIDYEFLTPEEVISLLNSNHNVSVLRDIVQGVIEINSQEGWEIANEMEFKSDGGIDLENVIINLEDKTITLQ